jgi:hypothetical protein
MPTLDILEDVMKQESDYESDFLGASRISSKDIHSFPLIPVKGLIGKARKIAYTVNSLANLYWFSVIILHKNKFQTNPDPLKNLHLQMCNLVMKDGLKEVIEIPRDHYKSSVYSECFPMWRALPFTAEYEDIFKKLGASDRYIEWMKRIHSQDVRILLVSETIGNAIKLGLRINNHYVNNELFRYVFQEILPDSSCIWKSESYHQKRTKQGSGHGEGTFDFIGVGSALQSRHYDDVVQDDLVGKEALKSEIVMRDTIEYHQLLVGAFEADVTDGKRDNNEIVVGNRWAYNDLNSHIRVNEKEFTFVTHSALGGCCKLHPPGTPIFPEAFSLEKLYNWKRRLGTYLYSCQFENLPIDPSKQIFRKENFRYFSFEKDYSTFTFREDQVSKNEQATEGEQVRHHRTLIKHHVNEGDVEDNIYPRNLKRYMIVDPNHAMQKGRARHAITVTGISQRPQRVYLLDVWAEASTATKFVQQIFKLAKVWKITEIYLETVGFQKFLKFHLEYYIQMNRDKPGNEYMRAITFKELKSSTALNAKKERIDSFVPITERKELWLDAKNCDLFVDEAEKYGTPGALVDVLDTLSYGLQVWNFDTVSDAELEKYLRVRQQRFVRSMTLQAAG